MPVGYLTRYIKGEDRRRLHARTLGATVVLATLTMLIVPGLRADAAATFSTISGFLTLYGVLFAVLEVLRLERSTEIAAQKATQAADRVETVYRARHLEECNAAVKLALSVLDKKEHVPSTMLHQIQDQYSRQFLSEMANSQSAHRNRVGLLQSLSPATAQASAAGRSKLAGVLMEIAFDLTVAAETKASEVKK